MGYLDNNGLLYFWGKLKTYIASQIPSNIVTGSTKSYTIWEGTQAEYDALATKDSSTIYLIKES